MASSPQESPSSVDWQTTKPTVRDRTAFLFNNSLMSDIKFVVTDSQHESDGTQVRVPAHKLVLAISSPVFEAMFYGDLAEKKDEVILPDTDGKCLLELLRFIYCDEVNLTTDNVLGVLYVSKKYIVPALAAKCRSFLTEEVDETNVSQILEEAKRFEESVLEERCWEIIDSDTSTCLESDRVLTLSHDTLVSLLKRDTLCAQEVHLFDAIKHWAEAKCNEKGLEKTGSAIREMLGDVVDFIRFPTMSQEEFARCVVPTEILTSDAALKVYQWFSGVATAEQLKFSCSNRARFTNMSLQRCGRYVNPSTSTITPAEITPITEEFTLSTDKDIHLRGVRLFGGPNARLKVKAVVQVLTEGKGKQLATAEVTFPGQYDFTGRSNFHWGFDVVFDSPVRVRARSKYVCHATVTGLDGAKVWYNNAKSLPIANCAGVNFWFEEIQRSTCQVLEVLFYTDS